MLGNRPISSGALDSNITQAYFAVTASGGAVYGSGASAKIVFSPLATGGSSFGGSCVVSPRYLVGCSGGAVLGNAASSKISLTALATGNGVFGGTCVSSMRVTALASSGAVIGGSAVCGVRFEVVASGGCGLGGSSSSKISLTALAVGNGVFGGTALVAVRFEVVGSGGCGLGGTSGVGSLTEAVATGGSRFGSGADVGVVIAVVASGGVRLGNAANAQLTLLSLSETHLGANGTCLVAFSVPGDASGRGVFGSGADVVVRFSVVAGGCGRFGGSAVSSMTVVVPFDMSGLIDGFGLSAELLVAAQVGELVGSVSAVVDLDEVVLADETQDSGFLEGGSVLGEIGSGSMSGSLS